MFRVEMDLRGFDRLKQRVKDLQRTHRVPVSELMTASFLRGCSRFGSFQEMVDASPFVGQDFEAIPDTGWDDIVRQHTRFSSWQAMLHEAAADWVSRQLLQ